MRTANADDPLIGVSCGHRVPRKPVTMKYDAGGQAIKRYWCMECGTYRMSGGPATGGRAFDFLLELRDEISSRGLVVDDPGTEQGRAVVSAFGARIRLGKSMGKS
ncbi:MAG TPA: hypothetical protein VHP82_10965 [Gaiellaceae bacterium]|nr:hypothetical protein [Gaiellaceae bacterium]